MVGAQGLCDGAHGATVVALLHVTQELLCLGELLQAVQPEVEMLRRHTGPETLVKLARELMTALQINSKPFIILFRCDVIFIIKVTDHAGGLPCNAIHRPAICNVLQLLLDDSLHFR